jgi:hypothetical protein
MHLESISRQTRTSDNTDENADALQLLPTEIFELILDSGEFIKRLVS